MRSDLMIVKPIVLFLSMMLVNEVLYKWIDYLIVIFISTNGSQQDPPDEEAPC